MFPKMCQEAGLDFEELTNLLINEAVLRYNARAKLQTSR
jgi:D-alanine-D-alanine ligase